MIVRTPIFSWTTAAKHILRVAAYTIAAFIGLWIYMLPAMLIGWMSPPIWHGGEAWLQVYAASLVLFFGAVPFYWGITLVLRKLGDIRSISYWQLSTVGIVHGLILFPCLELVGLLGYFLRKLPWWSDVGMLERAFILFVVAGVVSAGISVMVVFLASQFKKGLRKR